MKDKSFLDTNLIVYLFDESEDEKHRKANTLFEEYIKSKDIFISVQVINEFIVIGTKKSKNPISFIEIEKRVRF
jgi:predicted nucleic acid-binding protein